MTSVPVDEVEAFRIASATAAERGWPWLPPYYVDLIAEGWSVRSESELEVRIDVKSGSAVPAEAPLPSLDPSQALVLAREYALQNGHSWKPSFALELTPTHWVVGACQSQFGGQTAIAVSHAGQVTSIRVNPK